MVGVQQAGSRNGVGSNPASSLAASVEVPETARTPRAEEVNDNLGENSFEALLR